MTWNYRILLFQDATPPYYALHEVFYDDDGEPSSWTEEPADFMGDTREETIGGLSKAFIDARDKPVLVIQSSIQGDKIIPPQPIGSATIKRAAPQP